MKKFLIITTLSLMSVCSLTAFNSYLQPENNDQRNCQHGQCAKIKKDGYQCRNCAQQGSYYCYSHRPRY